MRRRSLRLICQVRLNLYRMSLALRLADLLDEVEVVEEERVCVEVKIDVIRYQLALAKTLLLTANFGIVRWCAYDGGVRVSHLRLLK